MNVKHRYVKIVEWSEEDQCFIGSCPGLFYGGCHGSDKEQVFAELSEMVEEAIELYIQDGKALPSNLSGKNCGVPSVAPETFYKTNEIVAVNH